MLSMPTVLASSRACGMALSNGRQRTGLYAVSVDPITWGHLDIVERAGKLFDRLVLGIGANPAKKYAFTADERVSLSEQAVQLVRPRLPAGVDVRVQTYSGLTAETAYRSGCTALVRGVRNAADLNDELMLHSVQQQLRPSLESVLLPCRPELTQCSSTVVRQLVAEGGDASAYCPLVVKEAAERRLLGRTVVGVVGGMATGKSTLCQRLAEQLQRRAADTPVHVVSLDHVGHYVLGRQATAPCYADCKATIAAEFGSALLVHHADDSSTSIDRAALARLVFDAPPLLQRLSAIMQQPMTARLYEIMAKLPGIFLVEGAVLLELGWSHVVNNTVVLVDTPRHEQLRRLTERHSSAHEAERRLQAQMTTDQRMALFESLRQKACWGRCATFVTEQSRHPPIDHLSDEILDLHRSPTPWLRPSFNQQQFI